MLLHTGWLLRSRRHAPSQSTQLTPLKCKTCAQFIQLGSIKAIAGGWWGVGRLWIVSAYLTGLVDKFCGFAQHTQLCTHRERHDSRSQHSSNMKQARQELLPNTSSGLIVLSYSQAVHSIQVHRGVTGKACPGMSLRQQSKQTG